MEVTIQINPTQIHHAKNMKDLRKKVKRIKSKLNHNEKAIINIVFSVTKIKTT